MMATPGFDPAIVKEASAAQQAAADPGYTVFVEANAGSGKTRVLVDRVARLLLAGVRPDSILCVTFTKAAAGEMQARLFKKLGEWSVMADGKLQGAFKELTGDAQEPDSAALASARRLFARALETPGGLKIQTLHAFCDSLLRQFPMEAGLPPGFSTQDDATSARVRRDAERDVYLDARRAPESPLAREIARLTELGGPKGFEAVFAFAAKERHLLSALFEAHQGEAALVAVLANRLGIDPDADGDRIRRDAMAALDADALVRCAEALAASKGAKDQARAKALYEVLDALSAGEFEGAYDAYRRFLLSKKGEFYAAFFNGKQEEVHPDLARLFGQEPRGTELVRMEEVFAKLAAERTLALSRAALTIARQYIRHYERALARERAVDFDDLIARTNYLLRDGEMAGWVRYRLDAGLEHILVDEAQDTSPAQWDVIDALADEFFAGEGVERAGLARSVFCVGDEKQSIYSFQKADPRRFVAQGHALERMAGDAGRRFARPPLATSFRSSADVLAAVDAAFAAEKAAIEHKAALRAPDVKFVAPDTDASAATPFSRYQDHHAARANTPGCVEIWPIVPYPPKGEEDSLDDYGPVDTERQSSARNQLAKAVADEIRALLDRGDTVWEEKPNWHRRAARPGDIIILVRKRDGLFNEIIRRLKINRVPVAGADRLTLPDQLVVEDMLALARFALLPEDDLSLAAVLKSPAFHPLDNDVPVIDEDCLFDLAHGRNGRSLWEALLADTSPALDDARLALKAVRARVDTSTPYSFFARFLGERTAGGETRAARIYSRLREEARDPLEAFLSRALAHERAGAPSLARFIDEMARINGELKREAEGGRNEVRVMTVHGAKGLEAPIVFLPDTNGPAAGRTPLMFPDAECGLVWRENDPFAAPMITELGDGWKRDQSAESARLLYVAMTRARDRLVVCGYMRGNEKAPNKTGWYTRLQAAWQGEDWRPADTAIDAIAEQYEWPAESRAKALRFGKDPVTAEREDEASQAVPELPGWARSPARCETVTSRAIAPSRLLAGLEAGEAPAGLSPLADGGRDRFQRGTLVHKLLQILPDIAPERQDEAARHFLERQEGLDEAARAAIARETLGLIRDPAFAPLFGPGSRAEVSLSGSAPGLPAGVRVNGQIDRLVVTPDSVLIVDFKTNRPPPAEVDAVAPAYLAQMGAYRALLRALYPGRQVRCALVWTDAARLMELPDAAMDAALELAAQPGALDREVSAS
ncbi:MAG: double-strand break repair helicase AddA [Caulobacterales bacterium]|uniref:double-strand break repair helicase AddA n=1 Tax=Glycocaulis sp. TaxID=1969725 RepID=UPI003F9F3BA6